MLLGVVIQDANGAAATFKTQGISNASKVEAQADVKVFILEIKWTW